MDKESEHGFIEISETWLINLLKEEAKKRYLAFHQAEIVLPSLEERIEKQLTMLDKSLPSVLEEGILRNLINLTTRKIKRDYCE